MGASSGLPCLLLFLWAFCVIFHILFVWLLKKKKKKRNDLFRSDVPQCERQGSIVTARVCVRAFVDETEPVCSDSIAYAGSHCCTVTWTLRNTGREKKKKQKQKWKQGSNTGGCVGGHSSSTTAAHVKRNISIRVLQWKMPVLISLFGQNSLRVCVRVCSVTSLLLWPSCSCCAKQDRLCSKPVTTG